MRRILSIVEFILGVICLWKMSNAAQTNANFFAPYSQQLQPQQFQSQQFQPQQFQPQQFQPRPFPALQPQPQRPFVQPNPPAYRSAKPPVILRRPIPVFPSQKAQLPINSKRSGYAATRSDIPIVTSQQPVSQQPSANALPPLQPRTDVVSQMSGTVSNLPPNLQPTVFGANSQVTPVVAAGLNAMVPATSGIANPASLQSANAAVIDPNTGYPVVQPFQGLGTVQNTGTNLASSPTGNFVSSSPQNPQLLNNIQGATPLVGTGNPNANLQATLASLANLANAAGIYTQPTTNIQGSATTASQLPQQVNSVLNNPTVQQSTSNLLNTVPVVSQPLVNPFSGMMTGQQPQLPQQPNILQPNNQGLAAVQNAAANLLTALNNAQNQATANNLVPGQRPLSNLIPGVQAQLGTDLSGNLINPIRSADPQNLIGASMGQVCWLRISIGPQYPQLSNWQRTIICTGSPVTHNNMRAIVTGAHCFFWRNKDNVVGFDWDNNQQLSRDPSGMWLNFEGDIEVFCGLEPLVEPTQILKLYSRPDNNIVRVHAQFDGYRPEATNELFGTTNIAIIHVSSRCNSVLLLEKGTQWSFPAFEIPQGLPTPATSCQIVSYGPLDAVRKVGVAVVSQYDVCGRRWPNQGGVNAICLDAPDAAAGGKITIHDNGGPVFCQDTNNNWILDGIGFVLKASERYAMAASTFSNQVFLQQALGTQFPDDNCPQQRRASKFFRAT